MDSLVLRITPEQQKLIASVLRTRILHLTAEHPLTAKQVAQALGETPGNVHYHLQKLLGGGLVEIVETRRHRGALEKYYRAKATHFVIAGEGQPERPWGLIESYMSLTDEESRQLIIELGEVLHRWEKAKAHSPSLGSSARRIEVHVNRGGAEEPPDRRRQSGDEEVNE